MLRRLAPALLASVLILPALAVTWPAHPTTSPDITAADISARDKALADDVFEGRGPGTKAGEASAQWIADELKRIGIKPGNHGSYFQNVPSVTITLDQNASSLSIATPKGTLTPKFADDIVYWSPRFGSPDQEVKNSDIVFVGYGVVAPEYNWNDYAGVDVKGKTVVVLINDPGNEDAHPDPKFFKGRAMTYYGRWVYKFEEAARQGAAAVIIVHETKPAAYGWQVVRNSNGAALMWLDAADKNMSYAPIHSWVQLDVAKQMFANAGLDYATLKAAANKPGFKAVPLTGETLTVHAHSDIMHMTTRNVIGMIPGTKHPDDVFMYSAHWDHLGKKPNIPGDDKIYNGAEDNAMGVSIVLDLAEKFAHDKKPQRTLAFAFWSLEEQGLLGSEYFGKHPIWPRNHIVGVINMDGGGPSPLAHDMSASGTGQSELEDAIKDALATQNGRVLTPDAEPEKGHFYRSDHFSLAKVGIPAISPGTGRDLVVGGTAEGQRRADDYNTNRYHQPSDEWKPDWDLAGTVQDARALYIVGDTLANSDIWPNYYKDSEFRAIRDKDMAAKKK
jgi:Zn-dependent M28 family amino/carboxypeptidase